MLDERTVQFFVVGAGGILILFFFAMQGAEYFKSKRKKQ